MMNIYDCFSPTILIIYRYFQFSSSRSPTQRRASPGVLKRLHNNAVGRLLGWLGPGRISQHRASIGMQGRAARQELREARCLRQPPRLPGLWAGLAHGHWLLQPLRLQRCCSCPRPAGAAALGRGAAGWPAPLPGLLPLRRSSVAGPHPAGARAAILFDPSFRDGANWRGTSLSSEGFYLD